MTRTGQIGRTRGWIDGSENGNSSIGSADTGRRSAHRIDRFGKRSAKIGSVHRRHQWQIQLVAAFFGERQADQATAVFGHEVDRLRSCFLRSESHIAFIFAIFVIHQNDLTTLAELFGRFIYCSEFGGHKPMLAEEKATGAPARDAGVL